MTAMSARAAHAARRITFDPCAFLIRQPKARAAISHAAFARLIEQLGGAAVVAEDVSAFLQSERELIAVRNIAFSAGTAKAFRFLVPGMACGEADGRNHYGEQQYSHRGEPGDGAGTVGRGYRYGGAFLEVSTYVVDSRLLVRLELRVNRR